MVKVSVVIPVYNAEKYLRQCLDSVLGQSLREIEVICVDDGSTDGSIEILREYSERDRRFTALYNPENKHAGICRNLGLEKARGEYVLFLDSDDWILEGSLERIYEIAHRLNVDVLRCKALDYNNVSGTTTRSLHNSLKRVPFFLFNRVLKFKQIYWLLPKLNVAPWGGLFRREFLVENNIKFNDLICVNDRSFYWESMVKAEAIAFSKTELVCYRTNLSASLIGNRIKNFDCHFKSYEIVSEHVKNCPDKIQRCILNAELLDIAHWLEKAAGSEIYYEIKKKTSEFASSMDTKLWGESVKKTNWYRRFC